MRNGLFPWILWCCSIIQMEELRKKIISYYYLYRCSLKTLLLYRSLSRGRTNKHTSGRQSAVEQIIKFILPMKKKKTTNRKKNKKNNSGYTLKILTCINICGETNVTFFKKKCTKSYTTLFFFFFSILLSLLALTKITISAPYTQYTVHDTLHFKYIRNSTKQ